MFFYEMIMYYLSFIFTWLSWHKHTLTQMLS